MRYGPLLLVATLLPLTGCVESNLAAQARSEIESDLPGARFEMETALTFGRVPMSAARRIVAWSGEDGEDLDMLRRIRRMSMATYAVRTPPDGGPPPSLGGLERRLERKGWTAMLKSREPGEATWIFLREEGARGIRDLLVIELSDDEMVIVRVGGKLDRLIADAIADDPAGFGFALGG